MVIASVVLVAVAFVTLVAGWLGRVDPLIFASIVASVLAGGMLVASVVRPGRRKAATMAGHAPALAPVGDRVPKPSRPGAEEPVTWSGTVRTAPSSAPAGVLSEGPDVPDVPDVADVADVDEVDEVRGFLDDDLQALGERDVFADVEDAELVDEAMPDVGEHVDADAARLAPAEDEVLPGSGEPQRLSRPPSFPRAARPAPADVEEPADEAEAAPAGPRILYGRPLVSPPGELDEDGVPLAAMRGRRKPAPGKLVGPATASRPRVAGSADRSRAPKPAAAKPAAAKPTAAKPAVAKAAPSPKPAPRPKPAAKPVTKSPVKPAAKPAPRPAPAAPKVGPQATAAAAMPRRKPAQPPLPGLPGAAGPAAAKPAAKPSAPRPRSAPAKPEAEAAPAATERPPPGDARPGPRTRISFLGNRPPAPKSPPPPEEPQP